MTAKSALTLLLMVTFPEIALSCPVGSVAVKGNGWEGCVQNQGETEQPAGPQWRARWGAIAADTPNGILGASNNLAEKNEAKKSALASCYANGGKKCVVKLTYRNHCAVVINGTSNNFMLSAPTLEQAIDLGMKRCTLDEKNCKVFYSGCSLPVQI